MSEKFIVIFYDDDRKTILDKQEVKRESKVEYGGKTPEKPDQIGHIPFHSSPLWRGKGDKSPSKRNDAAPFPCLPGGSSIR